MQGLDRVEAGRSAGGFGSALPAALDAQARAGFACISTGPCPQEPGSGPASGATKRAGRWALRWTFRRHRCGQAREALARCHAKVAGERLDFLHQASARLVRDYDVIAVEKLNVKGLARSVLAKDVHDASWAKFISMLRYKAGCAGSRLIEVDPHDTSQDCVGPGLPNVAGCGMRAGGNLVLR